MNLKVFRVREGAKLPVRAHELDAGMDLFYCPGNNINMNIPPGASTVLSTGLKIAVPPNHMLEIKNKSGIAAKNQLLVGACVVDSGYDGEIFVNLHNTSSEFKRIASGQKIAQAVLIPIVIPTVTEIDEDNIYGSRTERGAGSLGSTGKF
jgi:dUTP pyrophosphatase